MDKPQEFTGKKHAAVSSAHPGKDRIEFCIIFLLTALHMFDFKIPKKCQIPKNKVCGGCIGRICGIKVSVIIYIYKHKI